MNRVVLLEDEDVGKYYIELIKKSIDNIEIYWAKSRSEVIQVIKENEIEVIIYDQRLENNELGTEIMIELKKINPNLVGLMVSAYATPSDTTKATKAGIMFDYINKRDITELPTKLVGALRYYAIQRELNEKNNKTYIGKVYKKIPFIHPLKIYIIKDKLLNDNYVFDDDWRDLYIINAGEEQFIKKTIDISKTIKVVNEYENEISSEFKLEKIKKLISSSFKSLLSIVQEQTLEYYEKRVEEIVKNFKMPQIPDDVNADYLTTIMLQGAQVYKQHELIIGQECTTCDNWSYYRFCVYLPTNRQRLRKVNTYRSGGQEIIEVSPRR